MSGFDASGLTCATGRSSLAQRGAGQDLARTWGARPDLHRGYGCGTGSNRRAPAPLLGTSSNGAGPLRPAFARRSGRSLSAWAGRPTQKKQLILSKGGKRITCICPRRPGARPGARFAVKPISLPRRPVRLGSADLFPKSRPRSCAAGRLLYGNDYNGQQRGHPSTTRRGHGLCLPRPPDPRQGFGEAAGPMAPALLSAVSTQRLFGERRRQRLATGRRRRNLDRALVRDSPAPCARPSWCLNPRSQTGSRSHAAALWSATPTRSRCRPSGRSQQPLPC